MWLSAAWERDGVEAADLLDDQLRLGRLGMGDVNGAWPAGVELRQFLRQGVGCQVLAALRQGAFVVAEGGFYDQHGHGQLVDALPKGGIGACVAAVGPPAAAAPHGIADGGNGVDSGQHLDVQPGKVQRLRGFELFVDQERRYGIGDSAEIRPDDVVENMGLQRGDGGGQGVHLHRRAAQGRHSVQHQGQGCHMVQVRMREQHMVDLAHFFQGEVTHAGACVDEDSPLDQKRGGATTLRNGPRASQHANLHATALSGVEAGYADAARQAPEG